MLQMRSMPLSLITLVTALDYRLTCSFSTKWWIASVCVGLRQFIYSSEIINNGLICATQLIWTPINCQVDAYNDTILSDVAGDKYTYVVADSLKDTEDIEFDGANGMLELNYPST